MSARGGVGVAADGHAHLGEVLGELQRGATRAAVDADGQDAVHARLLGVGDDLGRRPLDHVEVRVAVDHRFGNSGSSSPSPEPPSPAP